MAYILGIDIGDTNTRADLEIQKQEWLEYHEYLESVRERIPASAFEFATASWRRDPADHRSLHDCWVESLMIGEAAPGDRHESRSLEMQVRLLGPYHDGNTTLRYHSVYAYRLDLPFEHQSPPAGAGHGDWLCDEVRLSQRNHVLPEIEFSRGSRWVIECKDIEWIWVPFS